MSGRWGPEGKRAAVSFTFDNLGEASAIEFGRRPTDRPVGSHHLEESRIQASLSPQSA